MTMTTLIEQRLRDHCENARINEEFARQAEDDGKHYMATLYRHVAEGHLRAANKLRMMLHQLREDDYPAVMPLPA